MAEIIWSDLATHDYWSNIDYLLKDWSEKVAVYFIERVDSILKIIAERPDIFQLSEYKNIHFVPVTPQITLYYRIGNDNAIELLRFWSNYQDSGKLRM
jgi:plasmid stabilization system protein ParE